MKYIRYKRLMNEDFVDSYDNIENVENDDEIDPEIVKDLENNSKRGVTPFLILYLIEQMFMINPDLLYGRVDYQATKHLEFCESACKFKNPETGKKLLTGYHTLQRYSTEFDNDIDDIRIMIEYGFDDIMGISQPIFYLLQGRSNFYNNYILINHDDEIGSEEYNNLNYNGTGLYFPFSGDKVTTPVEIKNGKVIVNLNLIHSSTVNEDHSRFWRCTSATEKVLAYTLTNTEDSFEEHFNIEEWTWNNFKFFVEYLKSKNLNISDVPIPISYFVYNCYHNHQYNINADVRISSLYHLAEAWKALETRFNNTAELSDLLNNYKLNLNLYTSDFTTAGSKYDIVKTNFNNLSKSVVKKLVDEDIYIPPMHCNTNEFGYKLNLIKLLELLPSTLDEAMNWLYKG